MLDQDDREWLTRLPPSRDAGGRTVERVDCGRDGRVEGRTAATGEDHHPCPVCEFASHEYDDVYTHLMTAHRKSTISAALLRGCGPDPKRARE